MVAETATAPLIPVPCSDEEQHVESTTTCGNCGSESDLYSLGRSLICVNCIGAAVSLAANDIWVGLVSYTREFEKVVLM